MTPLDMKKAFPEAVLEIGENDEKLIVLVGDIGHFALQPFANACPGRYYNVGILEPTIVSMAAGLAATGYFPVVHTITPFITERSLEQIKLDFCYNGLGGNLIAVGSAFDYSTLGSTHHAYNDIATISSIPDTQVIYPASPKELRDLFKQTYNNNKLTYMRMARNPHGIEFDEVVFGKAVKVRSGNDLTIVVSGPQLKTAMNSVQLLVQEGIEPEILYYHTIKPFDINLLQESVVKTRRVLVIEEHISIGGLTHNVRESLNTATAYVIESICIPQTFLRHYGTYDEHCEAIGFTVKNILFQSTKLFQMELP